MMSTLQHLHAFGQVGLWALRRRRRARVTGRSMEPTLRDGEFVLVHPKAVPQVGQVVLTAHPYQNNVIVIKRLAAINEDASFELRSDNPSAGIDSRTWGPVVPSLLRGVVVWPHIEKQENRNC